MRTIFPDIRFFKPKMKGGETMKTKTFLIFGFVLGTVMLLTYQAQAVTIMIGDRDGFGFSSTTGLVSPQGCPADVDGNGIIEPGEFLPSLDGDGDVFPDGGDDFDNRSVAESVDTSGAQWTDISLSTSFAGSPELADKAFFNFTFNVPLFGDPDYGADHFINLVFGDYGGFPMSVFVDGSEIPLIPQNMPSQDGLVQLAYGQVSWADLLDGEVLVNIYAPNEPYVAFDYAFLDTKIGVTPSPEPSMLFLFGSGITGLAVFMKKLKIKIA